MALGLRKKAAPEKKKAVPDLSGNVHLIRDLVGLCQATKSRRGRRQGQATGRRLTRESAEIMASFMRTYLERAFPEGAVQVACEPLTAAEPVHVVVRSEGRICAVIRLLTDLADMGGSSRFGTSVRQMVEQYRRAGVVPDQVLLVVALLGASVDLADVEAVVGPVTSRQDFLTQADWHKQRERYVTVLKRRADSLPDPCRQIRFLSALDQLTLTPEERERLIQAGEQPDSGLWVDPIDTLLSYVEARCLA